MQVVKITQNGNTYIIKNLKKFVKKAMHLVNHSICQVETNFIINGKSVLIGGGGGGGF